MAEVRRDDDTPGKDNEMQQKTKKLRPGSPTENVLNEQPAADYKRERITNLILRVFGLSGEQVPAEILCLKSERLAKLLNEFKTDDVDFTNSEDFNAYFESSFMSLLHSITCPEHSSNDDTRMDISSDNNWTESALFPELYHVQNTTDERMFRYFCGFHVRLMNERENSFLEDYERDVLRLLSTGLFTNVASFLRGFFNSGERTTSAAVLLKAMLSRSLPGDFLNNLIAGSSSDMDTLADVFNPVLDMLGRGMNSTTFCSPNEEYRLPYQALGDLCAVKVDGARRPICTLLTQRTDWLPDAVSKAVGREISKLSYLGPFLSMSILPEDGDASVANAYFQVDDVPQETQRFVYGNLRNMLQIVRGDAHQVIHALLVNQESRSAVLNYLAAVINRNNKKAQIQADDTKVATDGFMLNFLGVMYTLSHKITVDKVNKVYPFHPNCRLEVQDQARMSLTAEALKEFQTELEVSFGDGGWEEAKFPTECFFLTMHAQHLSVMPCLQRQKRRQQFLREVDGRLGRAESDLKTLPVSDIVRRQRASAKLQQLTALRAKLKKSIYCAEAALLDDGLMGRALQFASKQLGILISVVAPEFASKPAELPAVAPKLFAAYPEFYLEDILDVVIYLLKSAPQVLLENCPPEVPSLLLPFICNTGYFNNPFLAAKVVEVLFMFCPSIQPAASRMHQSILFHPLANKSLIPSLIKFYGDVESTGSHTEFYDKFTIRQHIQVIFRCLWDNVLYRHQMIEYARLCNEQFVRFVSVVIDDCTFLLDESLEALKRIHLFEMLTDRKQEWDQLPREEQRRQRGVFEQDQRNVYSWLQLGKGTVDLFCYLTKDAPEPFYNPILGERLAAMLNYNMQQLTGSKCVNLKVRDAQKRYGWEPRRLLEMLTQIYLNLGGRSDQLQFAGYIAADERSYSQQLFDNVLDRLDRHAIVGGSQIEQLGQLAKNAFTIWKQNVQTEMDFGDDIPEEFLDPVMGSLMRDPVRLPSGYTMDRKVIERHLLSTQLDPFTRNPLSTDQLEADADLKSRIDQWVESKKRT